MNETRIRLYEELMEAQERIAQVRYARGLDDEAVLEAMNLAEVQPPEGERREDLVWSALAAYVQALGGRLELHAVFPEETVVVRRAG